MDLRQLEDAAQIIFEMCRRHPELCPHDYTWMGSSGPDENGYYKEKYMCRICGHEEIRMEQDMLKENQYE